MTKKQANRAGRLAAGRRGGSTGAGLRAMLAVAVVTFLVTPSIAAAQTEVVEYYHHDAVGSIRAVTNEAGQVIRRYDYMPFGELWQPTYPIPERRLFTGQERDHETGLDYFGARYYRPDIGRFTTVDPGHVGANIFDPQRWNAYGYARNNPLRFVDPSGRSWILAANQSKADVAFLRRAIAEAIRREEARELFLAIANDPTEVRVGVGSLNDSLLLANARNGIGVDIVFGRATDPNVVLGTIVLDRAVIGEFGGFAGVDRRGVATFLHELYHSATAILVGSLAFSETDYPSSSTGLANTFAQWQNAVRGHDLLDLSAAMALVDRFLWPPTPEGLLPSRSLAGFCELAG